MYVHMLLVFNTLNFKQINTLSVSHIFKIIFVRMVYHTYTDAFSIAATFVRKFFKYVRRKEKIEIKTSDNERTDGRARQGALC